jgi:predicted nuclease of predicted toxin-antitoxin system
MILADENIDAKMVSILRSKNIEVVHIKEDHRGVSDEEIIRLSKNPPRIILTEDKDFGEWVYAHKEHDISVILLRYSFQEAQDIVSLLLNLIESRGNDLYGKFTTITLSSSESLAEDSDDLKLSNFYSQNLMKGTLSEVGFKRVFRHPYVRCIG